MQLEGQFTPNLLLLLLRNRKAGQGQKVLQLMLILMTLLLLLRCRESMRGGRRAIAERPVVNLLLLLLSGSKVKVLRSLSAGER